MLSTCTSAYGATMISDTIFFATANTQKDLQESFLFTLKTWVFISFFKSYCPFYAEGQILYYVTDKNAAPLPEKPFCFHLKNALLLLFLHLQLQAHFMSRQTESVVAQEAEVADA